ncbi:class I SAM-dependent methyltransferase [Cognatilysobacter lacus]|uniref:Class I SAM-dependent methyltransferase n=1 Tax=Cognatilysobacter lacus TaxID=1643323 RepID=A0A5D8Z768_9GAMM|nr:class I SAM-dependent methyltransferase [Lysobacter lacus]TZF89923.1 class I SAM-dependent methyltransferase [Lysobacter lacus]
MTVRDHFSGVAQAYVAARPHYPPALFDAIARFVPPSARVWEPGCGSGQATRDLAPRSAHVHATDPSAQQLAQHWAREAVAPNVTLANEPGEHTSLGDRSVELVAVAQALHWFDVAAFFVECDRVLRPGGLIAAWGYDDFDIPEGMAAAVDPFRARIEQDWPTERDFIKRHYADFDWPFAPLDAPPLALEVDWSFERFIGYLSSFSAVVQHRARTGDDAVALHRDALRQAWGAVQTRHIRWPLFLHLRRKPG